MSGTHFLVVTAVGDGLEPDPEWEIEHPPDCPTEVASYGPYHVCMIGAEFESAGLDAIGGASELPPPGRYPLIGHAQSSPSGWWGPAEYWVEIEIGEASDASSQKDTG